MGSHPALRNWPPIPGVTFSDRAEWRRTSYYHNRRLAKDWWALKRAVLNAFEPLYLLLTRPI